jgi:hypothetical protein
MLTWISRWLTCRHREVIYDRVNGVKVWRCWACHQVRERGV